MTHITTGWMDGIFTRGKLFSRRSSSFLYLGEEKEKPDVHFYPDVQIPSTVVHPTYLSSAFPSEAIAETLSRSFSRSSSNTDWWNSSLGVPWRSRKGRAD